MSKSSPVYFLIVFIALGLGVSAGYLLKSRLSSSGGTSGASAEQLWTCGMHPNVIQNKPGICPICHMKLTPLKRGGQAADGSSGGQAGGGLVIDPVVVQNMGLRVELVQSGPLLTKIRAAGFVKEAQPLQRDFSLKIGGWIKKLHAHTEGMHLRQGDPLFELYSPALLTAQEELIAAQRAVDRAPANAGASSYDDAPRLLEAARQKLLLWDLSPEEVDDIARERKARPTLTFRSPAAGHLVERLVVEGSAVEPGQKLFRIVDHSKLWLDIQIYERQMPFVSLGLEATATVLADPGKVWTGQIIFIHPHVDEVTRTAMARIEIENPGLRLKPGMYAASEIEARLADEAVLAPREAVIDTGVRQIAFVAREGGRFEPRELKLGAQNDEAVQVLEGLAPGEKVVVSGQFLLDVESRTEEAVQKLLSEKLASPQGAGGAAAASAPGKAPSGNVLPGSTAPADAAPVDVKTAGLLRPEVDRLFLAYVELARALAADDEKRLSPAEDRFAAEANALASQAKAGPADRSAREVLESASALKGSKLKEARGRFKTASERMIRLLDSIPPSRAVGEKLYVVDCEMFPGKWVQVSGEVANPFYGGEMLRCGSVKRTIEPAGR